MLNPDFRDMLVEFNGGAVEYLVVGGYAVAHHGYPRATGDMGFWVRRSPENAERVLRALAAFGAPNGLVTREELLDPEVVAQIGVEPNRIDILTAIDGVEFDDAYPDRVITRLGDVDIPFVGLHHLLMNKRATGRPEDLVDVSRLEAALSRAATQPPWKTRTGARDTPPQPPQRGGGSKQR
jgi:hypothetical protein